MDFLASSSKTLKFDEGAATERTPREGAAGANAETAGRARRATAALMSFMVKEGGWGVYLAIELQIVSTLQTHFHSSSIKKTSVWSRFRREEEQSMH